MSITVSEVSKSYGPQLALDKISFEIKKGEIVGFLGPNGAGKSTMMRILTTYYRADEGAVTVNGFDVVAEATEVKKSVGYLPENNPLYPELYVREYLSFHAGLHGTPKSAIQTAVEATGLTGEAHKKIKSLSKGYKQRVGLAAAILHDPEVLILDEPTTGLDPNQLIEIRKLIRSLGKEKTILLSTHILKEVEAICDRVIIINSGKIVADASLSELRKSEQQIIEVEFDYRVEEAFLLKLPHAKSVLNTAGFTYEIHFDTHKDMRPALFDFAHDNELRTLQLSRKNKNLESLFTELTTSSEASE